MNELNIIQIIKGEDKRNPFTDKEIGEKLNIAREAVTEMRIQEGIPNSRERREKFIYEDIKKILLEDANISDRKLAGRLKEMGYEISRYSAVQMKKDIFERHKEVLIDSDKNEHEAKENAKENVKENVKMDERVDENVDEKVESNVKKYMKHQSGAPFEKIVGYNKSLKVQVSQAEAAILYPPHGLHTLLLGESGVGKTFFAQAMYDFAIKSGNFKKDAPFVIFNCADYSDNPQLLLSQLFGYAKGAFTGAIGDKKGLVEKAHGGILFLDEVHRLPSEGQEILFYLLDKGMYRRLGEAESTRKVDVMIIAATTEEPKTSLLLTFTRRIPMVIELPSIKDKPLEERYELISDFFSKESFRVGKEITITYEAVKALMLYECPGNVGQLRSDIQVACARGLLHAKVNNLNRIIVGINELPAHVKKEILEIHKREPKIENLFNSNINVSPNMLNKETKEKDRYVLPQNIYQFIEEKFSELQNEGLDKKTINKIVSEKVEFQLNNFVKNNELESMDVNKKLSAVVGSEIINAVEKTVEIARNFYDNVQKNFYYCVAIHLSSTCERLRNGKKIKNPQLDYIKSEYTLEYKVAKIMANQINEDLNIELPEDEIGFLAMYLKTFTNDKKSKESRVAVIVLTHGRVAGAMAEVANKLLGVNHAVGIEMSLDESPKEALKRTIEVVKKIDEGKGCLILVDMGSLVTFGEIITKDTDIPTRVIGRVDTVMVLEAVRRAMIPDSNLYEIVEALDGDKSYVGIVEGVQKASGNPKTIIALCITGHGTALKIKKYIEDLTESFDDDINVVSLGLIGEDAVEEEIKKLSSKSNVVAVVGTINPKIDNIPFVSFEEVLNGIGLNKIKKIIGVDDISEKEKIQYKKVTHLEKLLDEEIILLEENCTTKNEAIDKLCSLLQEKGYVSSEFTLSVYKREIVGATFIGNGVAIPHGEPECVIKPAIAIMKLEKSIRWEEERKVDFICMLAINENEKEGILELHSVISVPSKLNKIKEIKDAAEMKEKIIDEIM